MSIVDIAVAEAAKADAKAITEIEVEVGMLAGVMVEALSFCLEAAARATMAEAAAFNVIQVPGQGHCLACHCEVEISEFPAQCPLCNGFGVTITAGTEIRIRSISINDDNERSDN